RGAWPHADALEADPVLNAAGERLEDDQVFSRAGDEPHFRLDLETARPRDHSRLERKPRQRNVHGTPRKCFDEYDTMRKRKLPRVAETRGIVFQERIDVSFLLTQPSQKGEIDIARLPRLAPALDRHSPDHRALPSTRRAEGLHVC